MIGSILTSTGDMPLSAQSSSSATIFGGGGYPNGATMNEGGNMYRYLSGTGVSPGATGADSVLAVFSMPANSFDITGREIFVSAMGGFASNTNVKRVKLWWGATTAVVGSTISGGTLIADTGNYSTTGAVGWSIAASVFNISGVNAQLGIHVSSQMGSAIGPLLSPVTLSANESAAILIAVTGNATTTASDIVCNGFVVTGFN